MVRTSLVTYAEVDGTGDNLVERCASEPGEHLEAFPHVQIVNEEKERRRKRGRGKGRERKQRKNIQFRRRGLLERRERASGRGERPEGDSNGGSELDPSVT